MRLQQRFVVSPIAGVIVVIVVNVVVKVVVVHEPVVAHLHWVDEPDVLHPERLARPDDGAVVVLVGAPLDDAEDAGGPAANRGLRLAQEPVGELGSVEVSLGHVCGATRVWVRPQTRDSRKTRPERFGLFRSDFLLRPT